MVSLKWMRSLTNFCWLEFMPKLHLRQPGFTYSASGPFTKDRERIQKCKEIGNLKYIYKNE